MLVMWYVSDFIRLVDNNGTWLRDSESAELLQESLPSVHFRVYYV